MTQTRIDVFFLREHNDRFSVSRVCFSKVIESVVRFARSHRIFSWSHVVSPCKPHLTFFVSFLPNLTRYAVLWLHQAPLFAHVSAGRWPFFSRIPSGFPHVITDSLACRVTPRVIPGSTFHHNCTRFYNIFTNPIRMKIASNDCRS